ncbi:MAG TPA: L-seryl-tRNA(Sec) selenium transferase [Gemmataceae bacterium]|jgi:L-seryl-tRNA(Ser) seleniumtransferase|nr:L-seryl-tRNA(Sec) selenium transferase [Gemmataceae bacterium]
MSANPFRHLPAVNSVLEERSIVALEVTHGRDAVLAAVRRELDALRERLKNGETLDGEIAIPAVAARVAARVNAAAIPMLRSVINATGIVLHTNLGRSPLAAVAAEAAFNAARGYLNLELDLATGKRSSRQNPIRDAIVPLLGCESATAVNNCAAATVIVLRALAAGKEVIVSRGQLVEIGGSFRIPEIMGVSGASLREIGTTNITRIGDYEKAITPNTGLLLRVHPSNYRVSGFTKSASLQELVALGRKHNIPVIDDVGSGALIDFAYFGLPGDPVVGESLATGADLVLFSGDKLLGGPQAGLIVGKRELVQWIEEDPLMRAFRLDKMTLAALEATLKLYARPERALNEIPTLRMLGMTQEAIRGRGESLATQLRAIPGVTVEVRDDSAFVGGGSLPDLPVPTTVLAVTVDGLSDAVFAERLHAGNPAVLARVQDGQVLFDLRTVFADQEAELVGAVRGAN